jgi:hypothetical protein
MERMGPRNLAAIPPIWCGSTAVRPARRNNIKWEWSNRMGVLINAQRY